jgi:3-isopropylmalate dehydratase large subunit
MSHDTMTWLAVSEMRRLTDRIKFPERTVIVFDHANPPANIEQAKVQRKIMEFINKQNIKNFFTDGVCHQVMIEKGFARPGEIIIGSDSHTCSYGALGSFATGMGSTDIAVAFATGSTWFKIPESFQIEISGAFQHGVYAKDLILKIIADLGVSGANYKALEFTGETIEGLSIPERITICNMAIECGAKAGLVAPDETTVEYLKGRTKADYNLLIPSNGNYEKSFDFDITELEPQVACPHDLDNLKPVQAVKDTELHEVFIGTCTNGRYEDLEIAAKILKGKRVNNFTRTIIVPASVEVYQRAMINGLIKIFHDAGCIVCNPGCGPCLGRHQGVLGDDEVALTTMNRNFRGRMGSPKAFIYVASPATCAASAIFGKITDPREVL